MMGPGAAELPAPHANIALERAHVPAHLCRVPNRGLFLSVIYHITERERMSNESGSWLR